MKKLLILAVILSSSYLTTNSQSNNPGSNHANRFEELNYLLATPNEYKCLTRLVQIYWKNNSKKSPGVKKEKFSVF